MTDNSTSRSPLFSQATFRSLPVVGILRGYAADPAMALTSAAFRGGLRNIEVTMNSPAAPEILSAMRDEFGSRMNVGAGTVCDLESLSVALDAGAGFIVTPGVVPEVIKTCKERGVPIFAGALTPTEILAAWNLGADFVKVFPANRFGPGYIRDVKGPLDQVRLMPTGGVDVDSLPAYRAAGAEAFGVGSPLFARERASAGDWGWVETQARRFVQAYQAG